MPDDLRGLFKHIADKVQSDEISEPVAFYSIGWILFDIFERADHHQQKSGQPVTSSDLDRFVQDIPDARIHRDIEDATQSFGQHAAEFMEDDVQHRIKGAIDDSILNHVKSFTTGTKPFLLNVAAGVISGLIFAGVSLGLYFYVRVDPSLNAIGKAAMEHAQPKDH